MESEVKEILLSENNKQRVIAIQQQINQLNQKLSEVVKIILDSKEIDYTDKKVKISDDFSKIIIES
jgi:hypothetical protein